MQQPTLSQRIFCHMLEQTEAETLGFSHVLLKATMKWWQKIIISPNVFLF